MPRGLELVGLEAGALPAQPLRAGDVDHQLEAALVELGAVDLEDRALGTGLVAGLGGVARALHGQHEGLRVHLGARDLAADHRIGDRVAVAAQVLARQAGEGTAPLIASPSPAHGAEELGDHGALVAQQRLGHGPAAVDLAQHVGHRDPNLVEAGLAEGRFAADQLDGPRRDPRALHVDEQEGDALLLLRIRIRAHQGEDPVR